MIKSLLIYISQYLAVSSCLGFGLVLWVSMQTDDTKKQLFCRQKLRVLVSMVRDRNE